MTSVIPLRISSVLLAEERLSLHLNVEVVKVWCGAVTPDDDNLRNTSLNDFVIRDTCRVRCTSRTCSTMKMGYQWLMK